MRVRSLVSAAAVAAVASAAIAAPALAKKEPEPPKEFESSGGTKVKGEATGVTLFRFKPYKVKCTEAKVKGEQPEGKSGTLKATVKYENCFYGKHAEATFGNVEYEFLGNGEFKIVNEPVITLKQSKCTITLSAQTVGEEAKKPPATYSQGVGAEGGKAIGIAMKVKSTEHGESGGLSYEFGKVCEKFEEPSGEGGTMKGSLLEELPKGNILLL